MVEVVDEVLKEGKWDSITGGQTQSLRALLGGDLHGLLAAQTTSAASSNETDLLAGRSIAADGGGVANVLVVTTSVGMLHGVHSHTTNLGPAVALGLVLVVGASGLQHGLLSPASAGDLADHSAAPAGHNLLGAGGQLDAAQCPDLIHNIIRTYTYVADIRSTKC
jgi:hypothetical protein